MFHPQMQIWYPNCLCEKFIRGYLIKIKPQLQRVVLFSGQLSHLVLPGVRDTRVIFFLERLFSKPREVLLKS